MHAEAPFAPAARDGTEITALHATYAVTRDGQFRDAFGSAHRSMARSPPRGGLSESEVREVMQLVRSTTFVRLDDRGADDPPVDIPTEDPAFGRFQLGLSQRAIARQLGVSQMTVSRRLHKSVDRLRSTLLAVELVDGPNENTWEVVP